MLDLDADLERDRTQLLGALDEHSADDVPCRTGDLATTAAWTADDDAEQRVAASACTTCPLLAECRAYGLAWPTEAGTYGGLTERERRLRAARDTEKNS